jgi:hypothetical protein
MVVHKGTALPLVDLALRLPGARGAEAPARPRGKVLVTRARGVAVALGVDDVDPDVGGDEVPLLDVEAVIGGLLEDVVAAP